MWCGRCLRHSRARWQRLGSTNSWSRSRPTTAQISPTRSASTCLLFLSSSVFFMYFRKIYFLKIAWSQLHNFPTVALISFWLVRWSQWTSYESIVCDILVVSDVREWQKWQSTRYINVTPCLQNACTLNYLAFVIFIGKWFITQYLRDVHSGIVYHHCCIAIEVYKTKKDNFKCFWRTLQELCPFSPTCFTGYLAASGDSGGWILASVWTLRPRWSSQNNFSR